jgi:hypothetical protein
VFRHCDIGNVGWTKGNITSGAAEKDITIFKRRTEEGERWVEKMAEGHKENMRK